MKKKKWEPIIIGKDSKGRPLMDLVSAYEYGQMEEVMREEHKERKGKGNERNKKWSYR
jgi:hypothetical protein